MMQVPERMTAVHLIGHLGPDRQGVRSDGRGGASGTGLPGPMHAMDAGASGALAADMERTI